MARINENPKNVDPKSGKKLVEAKISDIEIGRIFCSQFVDHLYKSVSFQAVSLVHKEKLTEIIRSRAPYSLALTVPAMALTWVLAMIIASVVAYYRGSVVDKLGVFLSVLGMCVPFLAFMIYGQWLMFAIAPKHAYGLDNRANIYIPVLIMTIAGIGGSVRFYRTVILDETNRDYVRTALAKGVPLMGVMFKHVLKNCMLPILTNLVLAIPFLIMGSLLVESYFGIPGLGDLLISSISGRDEPILSGMVFLTALILTLGILITDLSYALFDPRVRLR
jgi:peptide/nickel transport system permease protein